MATIGDVFGMLGDMFQNQLMLRLVASAIIVLVGLFLVALSRKVFERIARARSKDRKTIENTQKMIEISIIIVTIFLVIYVLTQQTIIVLFLLGVLLVLIGASWEVVANLAAYYVILMNQRPSKGDYVAVHGFAGRVRDITPFFTLIDNDESVQAVPNRLLLGKGVTVFKEPSIVTVAVRVWGFEDPEVVESLLSVIRSRLLETLKDAIAVPGEAELYIDEITMDGVVIKIDVPMPGYPIKPNKRKIALLLREVAAALKETGYSFSVSVEKPNGMQARWRTIA